jgi:hypothetical protein
VERMGTLGGTGTEGFQVPIPSGPEGLEIGLAILDLLEDRFGAELIDFDLKDEGRSFTVRLPTTRARHGSSS